MCACGGFQEGEVEPPRLMWRRAQIVRPGRRRNRYPLSSAEGFFDTICALLSSRRHRVAIGLFCHVRIAHKKLVKGCHDLAAF
jgi:hypothetical protein